MCAFFRFLSLAAYCWSNWVEQFGCSSKNTRRKKIRSQSRWDELLCLVSDSSRQGFSRVLLAFQYLLGIASRLVSSRVWSPSTTIFDIARNFQITLYVKVHPTIKQSFQRKNDNFLKITCNVNLRFNKNRKILKFR